MKVWVNFWLLAVVLVILAPVSVGQKPSPTKNDKSKAEGSAQEDFSKDSFESLLRERDGLTTQIDALTGEIGWVNDAIDKGAELKRAKELKKPTEDIEKGLNDSLGYAHIAGTAVENLDAQLEAKQAVLKSKQQRKALIDAELIRRADIVQPQQNFKSKMSIIFAILVGVVIIGFFIVAFKDEQVRREIFSGQAGIQFVTLFSLVIAIILFGIIDVLEGKELAALLGGLSGYILGRSMSGANERSQSDGSSTKNATVTVGPPTISGFKPTTGSPGASVVITGARLTQSSGITFGGVKADTFTADSDTQLTATVPSGASTGKIGVTTPGGTAQSSASFTVA